MGFVAKNGDVENLTALEEFFHAGHPGHTVAREDQMFISGFVHAKHWLPFNTPLLLNAGEGAQADEHVFGGKRTPLF